MKTSNIGDAFQHGIDLLKGDDSVDKTFCSQKNYPGHQTARPAFARAREKVFDVNRWSDVSSLTAGFILHDAAGQPKPTGPPTVGDLIRLELPGPTPVNWVKVIQVVDAETKAGFTARPCADPHKNENRTEHFFTDESTSTFRVEWVGNTLTACQIGKNERINNQNPEAGGRAVVNTVIATTGWLLYQKIQWKTLMDYLLE
ncbi:hypothetical protein [Larkinella punicea]|uniref:Uncharacterized protein n=1 Tax=Larkinella punicea TaxID=2315727 RepID=A0A368JS49_9BACT|nr:hypothetical protein [Larkinella punicea]RCR70490.1 hypothetical protein DUE52_05925 [Larkinella punicea]